MPTTLTAPRVLAALVSGLATAAYYATPDFISSRTGRGWAKAGLTVVSGAVSAAVSVPDLRATIAEQRARADAAADGDGGAEPAIDGAEASPADVARSGAADTPALRDVPAPVLVGLGTLAVAASVAGTVAAERWIFRRGEARAAAGARYPHTRAGLVLGALTAVLALLPTDDDEDDRGPAGVTA